MPRSLAKLLSIAPGEERKTILLYSLHLIFYLGLMWGDAARETLFLSAWSADDLALVFVAYAILGFIIGLAYAFVADRISNGMLLKIIMGIMLIWLISVRVMLNTNGGPGGAVYPYFYLAYAAFRDVSTMHILTYINDFYDTRAAKRALPLMLSAGIAGGTLAGFTTSLLNKMVGLENTPLVWVGCLIVGFVLIVIIERQLRGDLEQIERRREQAHSSQTSKQSGLQNLRDGFDYVRKSGLLRTLAIATFAMVVIMNLLIYQSSRVFANEFAGNSEGLFAFYGVLGGISNVTGLLIQSMFLSRLINWLGVGTMNLLFPVVTLGSVAAINMVPGMPSAIFGRLDHGMIKQTFRNPLDAMLYNSIPVKTKARARGFVNGVIVPAGTLAAGLIVLAAKSKVITEPIIIGLGIGTALLYVLAMVTVRREYARSMTSLLAGDEVALFRQDPSEVLPPDPATLTWLRQKLAALPEDANADGQAVFIGQMLYDMDARSGLPLMLELGARRGAFYRKGVIEFLDQAKATQVEYIRFCQRRLEDPEAMVRESAATALLNYLNRDVASRSALISEESILNTLFTRLGDLTLDEQAQLVILLLRGGSPGQKSHAITLLESWLSAAVTEQLVDERQTIPVLEAGLIVLAEIERKGLQNLLEGSLTHSAVRQKLGAQTIRLRDLVEKMIAHPDPFVRRQVIPALVRESRQVHWDAAHWAVECLVRLFDDPEETIRLEVIDELHREGDALPLQPVLWKSLNDPSLTVRRAACQPSIHLDRAAWRLLWDALDAASMQNAPNRAESAVYLLRHFDQPGTSIPLGRIADTLVRDAYWLTLQGLVLNEVVQIDPQKRPGAGVMAEAFREDSLAVLDVVLWLLSASTSEEEVQAVQRALSSTDPTERANASEALEANLPPATARQLRRLLDNSSDEKILAVAEEELGLHKPGLSQVVQAAWSQLTPETTVPVIPRRVQHFYVDGWLTSTAIYLLLETRFELDLSISPQAIKNALQRTLESDTRANVKEAAALALQQLDSSAKDIPMSAEQPLTLIEKVIFLKEVPFFAELPLQEICILAGISEEVSYPAEHKIFSQGDTTKSLYLVIKGRVSVQQQTRTGSVVRLAQLGEKNYFAETSLFDGAPHQADIVTIDPTDILRIRQSTLFALIRRRPDIGLSLLKSLSQRLRETYAQVAQNERAKPQKLMSLFDKLEE